MKKGTIMNLLVILLVFISCNSEYYKNSETELKKTTDVNGYWISEEYLKCMEGKLPCDCNQFSEIILEISFSDSIVQVHDQDFFPEELYLSESKDSKIGVYGISGDPSTLLFEIKIDGSTITYLNGSLERNYVKNENNIFQNRKKGLLGVLNLDLLKKSLERSDEFETKLELKEFKESYLYCNSELQNVNLLFDKENCSRSKIIVGNGEFGYKVFNFLNSCESKVYPVKLDTVLLDVFE